MGYDKWNELTSEFKIKNIYCDIAILIAGKVQVLVEVKSAGTSLNDGHLRQAIDYGAHQGIQWIILTNAIEWRLIRVTLASQIVHETIASFEFTNLNSRKAEDLNYLFLLSKEGLDKKSMDVFYEHFSTVNAYTVSNIIRTDAVVLVIRREVKRYFPDVSVQLEDIVSLLENEVLKRETVESDKAKEASSTVRKAVKRYERKKNK